MSRTPGTNFSDCLAQAVAGKKTPAVVGVDPVLERLPGPLCATQAGLAAAVSAVETFSRAIIDAVAPHVPAIKINSGFFEVYYGEGVAAFFRLIAHAHRRGLLVISDVKRGDIGSTAALYARGHIADPTFEDIDPLQMPDAVTLAGYLGENAVRPFIEHAGRTGRGVYILVRPSDPGSDLVHEFGTGRRFYEHMAELVHQWGNSPELVGTGGLSCVGAVVAAKDTDSTRALRSAMPATPWLVPGYGAQGATAEACRACFLEGGGGAVVNASRSVIYAFERREYLDQFGDDWLACVECACRDFAQDLAGYCTGA